jgi:hypothetical protein
MARYRSLALALSLAGVLALGYLVFHALATMLVIAIADSVLSGSKQHEYLQVNREGRVIRILSTHDGDQLSWRTIEGLELTPNHSLDSLGGSEPVHVHPRNERQPVSGRHELPRFFPEARYFGWNGQVWSIRLAQPGSTRFYLEGYAFVGNRRLGCLSRAGFTPGRPAEAEMWESVSANPQWGVELSRFETKGGGLVAARDGIWRVELANRKVERILADVVTDRILTVLLIPADQDLRKVRASILVPQPDRLLFVELETLDRRELRLPPETADYSCSVYPLYGGRFLVSSPLAGSQSAQQLRWFEADGRISRQTTIALVQNQNPLNDLPGEVTGLTVACGVPCPVVLAAGWSLMGRNLDDGGRSFNSGLCGLLALSAISAAVCARHARQQNVPHRAAWVLFVALFGLAGLVGYWCHRRWPVPAVTEWLPTGVTTPPALTGAEVFA